MALTQQQIDQLVQQAYGSVGRTGFGTAPNQIDQGGYDYWSGQLQSGALAPDAFMPTFTSAVNQFVQQNPTAPQTQPLYDQLIRQAYGGIGRTGFGEGVGQIDQPGYDYWMGRLQSGELNPQNFQSAFTGVVGQALQEKPADPLTQYVQEQIVQQAYGDIGRTGFGEEAAQIDQPGYDYWLGRLQSGELTPETFAPEFAQATTQAVAERPEDKYSQQVLSTAAPTVFSPIGAGITDFDTLNRGFEWAQANKLNEDTLKKSLGEETYNQYAQQYGQGILEGLKPAFADNKLTAEEALDVVGNAKRRGLDAEEIAKYTKLNPELTNTLFDKYDQTVSGIVTKALDPESELTDQQKIGGILALQTQYGLTDKDIADYSGGKITEADAKAYLEPVRTFATDLEKTLSSPDLTSKQVNEFLDKAAESKAVQAIYGDKVAELDQKLNELDEKWGRYGTDPLQTNTLYEQINKINQVAAEKGVKNWSGSWMSGGENAAKEAAVRLQKLGVDSLADLKVQPQTSEQKATELYQGLTVNTDDKGRKYFIDPSIGTYEDGTPLPNAIKYLPSDAKTDFVFRDPDPEIGYSERALTAEELKTLDPKTGTFKRTVGNKLIDASTGKVIARNESFFGRANPSTNFVIDSYDTGNVFKSKDKTFGIMMSEDGIPVPYQTTEKGGLVYTPILPILASFLIPGLASSISGMLPGAGVAASGATAAIAPTALNTALSSSLAGGIMSGSMSALQGGNFGKGFLSGAVNPLASYGIGQLLPTNINPAIGQAIKDTAGSVVQTAIGGGDVSNALRGGVLSGLTNYAINPAINALKLNPTQLKLLTGIAIPTLLSGQFNPISAAMALAGTAKSGARQ